MKTLFYVIQKEFIQVKRDKAMLRMIIMIPLMQMLVLVFAATYDLKNVNIFLVDKDMSATSRKLAGKLRHRRSSPLTMRRSILKTEQRKLCAIGMTWFWSFRKDLNAI